ncbi:uncharacterized protein LOC112874939 isoform X2 [Panicum hallii]|uniref:uncharacterized protein LOC112874939 isoform X2 n=1 Tax=Panicum hallii TaxID=206008 RepID=UPI000DF4E44C|nr:uncharacterized protein LOC112874939 isoform X2 [Panicum hallii]
MICKKMFMFRWNEQVAHLCVEVVEKDGFQPAGTAGSNATGGPGYATSSVTDAGAAEGVGGTGDTCSLPNHAKEPFGQVDWSTLTIIVDAHYDGDMVTLADENKLFEVMGFKEADEKAEEEAAIEYGIPMIPAELQEDLREAGIPVDDKVDEDPVWDWDRDNLDMRVQINSGTYTYASTSRVLSTMASQAWVAERAIPLLKKKADMGAKEVQLELEDKYKISIPYQTIWYERQRAADKLFGTKEN